MDSRHITKKYTWVAKKEIINSREKLKSVSNIKDRKKEKEGGRDRAAGKSLQSCPTVCDPIDGSPPGSPVPGILQARTLEWVAISFSMHESEASVMSNN